MVDRNDDPIGRVRVDEMAVVACDLHITDNFNHAAWRIIRQ